MGKSEVSPLPISLTIFWKSAMNGLASWSMLLLDFSTLLPQHSSLPCSFIFCAQGLQVLLPETRISVPLTSSTASSFPHLLRFLKYPNTLEFSPVKMDSKTEPQDLVCNVHRCNGCDASVLY